MRSKRCAGEHQLSLWDGEAAPVSRETRRRPAAGDGERTLVISGSDFASRGWPAGTVLHHRPASRARRGDLAVVRDGEQLRVGFWRLEIGRPAIVTDRGSTWLGDSARVVGVVEAVEPPLVF